MHATNFAKAFHHLGIQSELPDQDKVVEEEGDDEEDEQTNRIPGEKDGILDSGKEDNDEQLPDHHCCAAHTLSLVATKDINASLKSFNHAYTKQFSRVFGKLQAVWNLYHRSSKFADLVQE